MRRVMSALCVLAALCALCACGSSGNGGGSGGSVRPTDAASTSGGATDAKLTALYQGVHFSTPTSPSKAANGKKFWVISCSQQVISCSVPAAAAVQAAKSLGWSTNLVDGKFSPTNWNGAIRQAVAAKADAIMLIAVDCGAVRQSLLAAKAKGVKIGAMFSIDCDDPSVKQPPLFDAPLIANNTKDWSAQVYQWAQGRADAIIAKTDGKAKVIDFNQDALLVGKYARLGFEKEMSTCSGCKIVDTVNLGLTDVGPPLQSKTQSAILQHPDANAVFPLYDGQTLAGVAAGVKASGRAAKLFVMGGEGYAPDMDLIRGHSGQNAAMGFSAEWGAYAVVDGLNRVFDGMQPQNSGVGWQLIDSSKNLPASGPWKPPVNFVSVYSKLWGLS
jgi:ribose transport system substrate-binding protein